MIITVFSVALELVLGMGLALVMHRAIFGRGVVRAAALIPYGIVTVVAAFAWRYAWSANTGFVPGLLGLSGDPLTQQFSSYVVIILTEVWKTTPFMALLLLAGLALVPDELHEAAKVDGASAWQRFVRITLPLIKPAILVALLFRTLDAVRIFDTVFIETAGAERHRDGLDPRLQPAAQPAEPRSRLGRVGAGLPDGRAARLPLHPRARRLGQPTGGERNEVHAARARRSGARASSWSSPSR